MMWKRPAETTRERYSGILPIDKPILYTSHDAVDFLRRKLHYQKIGHAGTLDPMATGLLILLIGNATREFEFLSALDKGYEGIITLGLETGTQDSEGEIVMNRDASGISEEDVCRRMRSFEGVQQQRTPLYSSAKIGGRKGYEMARKKIEFEPPLKKIHVKKFELLAYLNPDVYFGALVSKGTYLRAMAADLGQSLGVGGSLTCLRRVSTGDFSLNEALSLPQIQKLDPAEIFAVAERRFAQWKESHLRLPERPRRA